MEVRRSIFGKYPGLDIFNIGVYISRQSTVTSTNTTFSLKFSFVSAELWAWLCSVFSPGIILHPLLHHGLRLHQHLLCRQVCSPPVLPLVLWSDYWCFRARARRHIKPKNSVMKKEVWSELLRGSVRWSDISELLHGTDQDEAEGAEGATAAAAAAADQRDWGAAHHGAPAWRTNSGNLSEGPVSTYISVSRSHLVSSRWWSGLRLSLINHRPYNYMTDLWHPMTRSNSATSWLTTATTLSKRKVRLVLNKYDGVWQSVWLLRYGQLW